MNNINNEIITKDKTGVACLASGLRTDDKRFYAGI